MQGMNIKKTYKWLAMHNVMLEDCFSQSLMSLAKTYQKKHAIRRLDDVYRRLLGIRKQLVSYWENHPASTQTKNHFKQQLIRSAAEVFHLSEAETEGFANTAGLSLHRDTDFCAFLQSLIEKSGKSQGEIYQEAQVSERMFYLIKSGRPPAKVTLIALAAVLDIDIEEIERLLQKAGYVLSKSIAFDMVVKWLLVRKKRVIDINYVLDDLELPLLMTREKSLEKSLKKS